MLPTTSGDGRDLLQLKRDERVADVARVQDVVHAREQLFDLRVEKSVRVGNDAKFHVVKVKGGG